MTEVPIGADTQRLAELLPPLLTRRTGRPVTAVANLHKLSGGVSRHTWSFDTVDDGGATQGLILQQRPGFAVEPGIDTSTEATLLTAASDADLAVPNLIATDPDGRELGLPSLITKRIDGETIPQRILRNKRYEAARAGLACQYGETLGKLHQIPVEGLGLTRQDPVEYSREVLAALGDPHPALELAVRWLECHRPPSESTVVCHGDFRNGNGIVGPGGLRAVIDWELAHLGDPLEDVAWCCLRAWRFGHPLPVGGFGTYGDFIASYERAGGRRVDPDVFRWWQIAGTLRWAALCAMQTVTSRSGTHQSIEFTAVGRRICEAEFDLLLLLPTTWRQQLEEKQERASHDRAV